MRNADKVDKSVKHSQSLRSVLLCASVLVLVMLIGIPSGDNRMPGTIQKSPSQSIVPSGAPSQAVDVTQDFASREVATQLSPPAPADMKLRNYRSYLNLQYLQSSGTQSLPKVADSEQWIQEDFGLRLKEQLAQKVAQAK